MEFDNAVVLLNTLFPGAQRGNYEAAGIIVANPAYFDRYFAQTVPEHDVSDKEIRLVIKQARNENLDMLHAMLKDDIGDRIDTAITKLITFTQEYLENDANLGIISAIMETLPEILDNFVAHCALGDDAPINSDGILYANYLFHFAPDSSAHQIAESVGKVFSAADYAARFVSTARLLGAGDDVHRINGFETGIFRRLTIFDDPFFTETPINDFREWDISWQNRRAYAQGRANLSDLPSAGE